MLYHINERNHCWPIPGSVLIYITLSVALRERTCGTRSSILGEEDVGVEVDSCELKSVKRRNVSSNAGS